MLKTAIDGEEMVKAKLKKRKKNGEKNGEKNGDILAHLNVVRGEDKILPRIG